MTENQKPTETRRIEYRNQRNGWAKVSIKTGYGEDRKVLSVTKVRNTPDALLALTNQMKAEGYNGVSWSAVGTGYWIGETW